MILLGFKNSNSVVIFFIVITMTMNAYNIRINVCGLLGFEDIGKERKVKDREKF